MKPIEFLIWNHADGFMTIETIVEKEKTGFNVTFNKSQVPEDQIEKVVDDLKNLLKEKTEKWLGEQTDA